MKVLLALLVIVLSSCGGAKKTISKERSVRDSISTTVKIVNRDTLVKIPNDSLSINVPLIELSNTPIYKKSKSGHLTAIVSKVDDNIVVECKTDSLQLQLRLKDKLIRTLRSRLIETNEKITKPERYTPWWKNVLSIIGVIALAFLAGVIFKILK